MAGLNALYGSELHLLRMLGRHRHHFNSIVQRARASGRNRLAGFSLGRVVAEGRWKPSSLGSRVAANYISCPTTTQRKLSGHAPGLHTGKGILGCSGSPSTRSSEMKRV